MTWVKDTDHSSVRSTGSPYKYQTISTSAWFGKKEVNSPRSALILWQIISWFKLKQHKGLWTPTSCRPCELALNPPQPERKDLGGGSGANGPFTFTVCEKFLLEKQFLLLLPIWCKLTEQGSTKTHKQERSCERHRSAVYLSKTCQTHNNLGRWEREIFLLYFALHRCPQAMTPLRPLGLSWVREAKSELKDLTQQLGKVKAELRFNSHLLLSHLTWSIHTYSQS